MSDKPLFTCYTCAVGYNMPQLQRDHYKTDWHRYNLKRKVADLTPVTLANFEERVQAQKTEEETLKKNVTQKCTLCHKTFNSQKAYENHLQSKRHRESLSKQNAVPNVAQGTTCVEDLSQKNKNNIQKSADNKNENVSDKMAVDSATDGDSDDSWSSYEGTALGVEECLFCGFISDTIESNIQHMTLSHSFFIPDIEYLIDIEGLITYLGTKVGEGHLCLWCNEKGKHFHSTRAAQQHMTSKGHCMMVHEGDALWEYSDFYDYSASYPDNKDKDGEEENEEDSDNEELDDIEPLNDDGYELVLPSGATIGHRSLFRYYRQNIPEKRAVTHKRVLPNVLSQYKALGWTGTTGTLAVKKAADIKFMLRAKRRYDLKMSTKANKFQPHFRDPNGMIR